MTEIHCEVLWPNVQTRRKIHQSSVKERCKHVSCGTRYWIPILLHCCSKTGWYWNSSKWIQWQANTVSINIFLQFHKRQIYIEHWSVEWNLKIMKGIPYYFMMIPLFKITEKFRIRNQFVLWYVSLFLVLFWSPQTPSYN